MHALPASASRFINIHFHILFGKVDFDIIDFSQNGYGSCGCVDAALGFGGGDLLHAVNTRFEFQALLCGSALDYE